MKVGHTSALSLGVLVFVAATWARAEEPAAAAPDADASSQSELVGPRRPPGLGLSPIAPPTPPALGGRAASFGANKDPSEAAFRLGGTIFGSETVGIGTRGQATEPGQSSTPLHVPARYQGRLPLYVGVNAGILVTYGTPVVSATVTFYAHDSVEGATGNFLTAVTAGYRKHGQSEVVCTLRLPSDDDAITKMQELNRFFGTVHAWARQLQLTTAGGLTQFGERALFERGHSGILYADARPIPGIEIPSGAIVALLVDAAEVRTAVDFGAYRVLMRIGERYRHFPFPLWSDLDRPSVVNERENETVLAKLPRTRAVGASFVVEDERVRILLAPSVRATLGRGVARCTHRARHLGEPAGDHAAAELGRLVHGMRELLTSALLTFEIAAKQSVGPEARAVATLGRSLRRMRVLVESSAAELRIGASRRKVDHIVVSDVFELPRPPTPSGEA